MPTTPDTAPTPPSLRARMSGMASRMSESLASTVPQHPALDSITHNLRSLQQHHLPAALQSTNISSSATRELQLAITSQKGLALDYLACSRDGTLASKELYEWSRLGLGEDDDLVDAVDRLSFLSFTAAQLSTDLAKALDIARTPLKELRNLQNTIDQKNLAYQKASQIKKPTHTEIELQALQVELSGLINSLVAKRRAAVVSQQQQTWNAYTEYSSKIFLLSHASSLMLAPLVSGEWDADYAGNVRNSVGVALDRYEPGKFVETKHWPDFTRTSGDSAHHRVGDSASLNSIPTDSQHRPSSPSPSFSPSFGSTHAVALASIQRDPTTGIPSATGEPDVLPSDLSKHRRPSNSSSGGGRPAHSIHSSHFSRSAQEIAVFGREPLGTGRRPSEERPSVVMAAAGGSSEGRSSASGSASGSLNLSPTPLPLSVDEAGVKSPPLPLAGAPTVIDQRTGEGSMPTVAETGVPVTTSPGPSSGQFVPRRLSAGSPPLSGSALSSSNLAPLGLTPPSSFPVPAHPPSSSQDGSRPPSFSTSPSTSASMPEAPITSSTAAIEAQARERREAKRNSTDMGEGGWLAGEKDGVVAPGQGVEVTRRESTSSRTSGRETLPGYQTLEETMTSGPPPPGGRSDVADAGEERRLQ